MRNSLQTNLIVSNFKASVSSLCSFCLEADEQVSHLFWSCKVVKLFLDQIIVFLNTCNIQLNPVKKNILFGYHNLPFSNPKNFMLLLFKRFVWVMKFKTCILDLNAFKNFVRVHITDLKYMFDIIPFQTIL